MPKTMTATEFKVALDHLHTAARKVSATALEVESELNGIRSTFDTVVAAWQTPSSMTLEPVRTWFESSAQQLNGLLAEIGKRLGDSYATYHAMEQANVINLTLHNAVAGAGHGTGTASSRPHHTRPESGKSGENRLQHQVMPEQAPARNSSESAPLQQQITPAPRLVKVVHTA